MANKVAKIRRDDLNWREEQTAFFDLMVFLFPRDDDELADERVRAFLENVVYALAYDDDKQSRDNLACVIADAAFNRTRARDRAASAFLEKISQP